VHSRYTGRTSGGGESTSSIHILMWLQAVSVSVEVNVLRQQKAKDNLIIKKC